MKIDFDRAKRTLTAFGFGAALWLASGATSSLEAHDQYYDRGRSGYQGRDRRDQKAHQKSEKQALKDHQREERRLYGNSRALREHQKREKDDLKYHQRNEKNRFRDYDRDGNHYNDRSYRRNRYENWRY